MPHCLWLVCVIAAPNLEIQGMSRYLWSSCTALLLLVSLGRDEVWFWSIADFLTPVFWLCVKFICVKSSAYKKIPQKALCEPLYAWGVHAPANLWFSVLSLIHLRWESDSPDWSIFCVSRCSYKCNLSWYVRSQLLVSSNVSSNTFGLLPSGTLSWIHFLLGEPSFDCRFPSCSFIHRHGVSSGHSLTLMIGVYPKLSLALNKPSPKEKPGITKHRLQGMSFWEYTTFELVDDCSAWCLELLL